MLSFLIAYIMELITEGGPCDVSLFSPTLLMIMVRLVDIWMQCGEINHQQSSR